MKYIIPFTSAEPRTLEQATIISNAWSKGQFSEMFQPMPEGEKPTWGREYNTAEPHPDYPGFWRITNRFDPRLRNRFRF